MPAPASPSNIRAYVQWKEPSVYAGEEIECIITFRNIAPKEGSSNEERAPLANGSSAPSRAPSYSASPAPSRRASVAQSRPPTSRGLPVVGVKGTPGSRGHRPTLSLSVVSAPGRGGLHSAPLPGYGPSGAIRGHGRSLSIMSLGSDAPIENKTPSVAHGRTRPLRGGHSRSASLQYVPKQVPVNANGNLGLGIGMSRQPSPLNESSTPASRSESPGDPPAIRPTRRRPGTVSAGNTPQLGKDEGFDSGQAEGVFNANFQFPAKPSGGSRLPSPPPFERSRRPRAMANMHSAQYRATSPRPSEAWHGTSGSLNPISRVMSESSFGDTPRSSGEFYTMSNNSDETLTSEAPYRDVGNLRALPNPAMSRQHSHTRPGKQQKPAAPETLMMGFAQTMGNFTLDGSLVNAAPFEEVKRRAVSSGGGVVGLEHSKRSSGMFGAFSWSNIGESLSGLLGGDDMSTVAQMKAVAGSKSVPLLSTPQSLLFVDLTLAPGESRSYKYQFTLPRGLPPSHRGRAIKVNYYLSVGLQREGGQAFKHVEVPFRVLGSYNAHGESLGHDLMSPYILLQDPARTASVTQEAFVLSGAPTFPEKAVPKNAKSAKQGLEDFLRYTERLLDTPTDVHGALLSPTLPLASPPPSRQQSFSDSAFISTKEAVNMAILRANHVNVSGKQKQSEAQSANRFNIARSGQPVAVLTILRPAFRLGETVSGVLDFSLDTSTYGVLMQLESTERVDPTLALRSSNSISRVTRKVHSVSRENTLFARRISFALVVPSAATPSFETTGVSLSWQLRVEFTTQRQQSPVASTESPSMPQSDDLLEELGTDDRGTVLIAREALAVETFEIAVPLKIYGSPGTESFGGDPEALQM